MKMKCYGNIKNNCEKTWPEDKSQWHHNFGLQSGDGSTDESDNYKMDYEKMCHECYEKLTDKEKKSWPLIE